MKLKVDGSVLEEKTNIAVLNKYFPNIKHNNMPHFVSLFGDETVYVWFNYEAKKNNKGEYIPGDPRKKNKYKNIYKGNTLREIAPTLQEAQKYYGDIRITFRKVGSKIYFAGVYKLVKIVENIRYFKRILDEIDCNNISDSLINSLNYKKVLICNLTYMKYYKGINDDDKPSNNIIGPKHGYVYEKDNFNYYKYNNGSIRGFVETDKKGGYESKGPRNTIHIENLDNSYANENFIKNVLVVFIAKESVNNTVIVGWYKNAKVFRKCQKKNDDYYFFKANTKDAYLVDYKKRNFRVDRNKIKIGQHNIKYAKDIDFNEVYKIVSYIDNKAIPSIEKTRQKEDDLNKDVSNLFKDETVKEHLSKYRTYQNIFRNKLLNKYNCKCCLCDVNIPEILVASHILEHSKASNRGRQDINNGLLLCATHDALFDKHLISFNDEGEIIISRKINEKDYKKLLIRKNMKITLTKENQKYMKKHRSELK